MTRERQVGKIPVIAAIIGNSTVTVFKFIIFLITGANSMFAEAIHTFADSMNQVLLLIGINKSKQPADDHFSYGHGKERFFWALLSACGIFFLGAGVTVYHGIHGLLNPIDMTKFNEYIFRSFLVLVLSFIIEGFTLGVALKSAYKKELGFFQSIKEADNASFAVILEDSVAVFGVLVAIIAIFLTKITGITYFDSIGSIFIGTLLGIVAILLILKNREYLLGKAIDEEIKEDLIDIISNDQCVLKLIDFKSEVIGMDSYIIKCEIEFNGTILMKYLKRGGLLQKEYDEIENYEDFLRFNVYSTSRIPRMIGKSIDKLEKKIREKYPQIRHIDIELN